MDADVAIVGAGIIGLLCARELSAREPHLSILVLERDAVGSGASRRSAGLHLPRGSSVRVREMSAYSQDYYQALVADRGSRGLPTPIRQLPMVIAIDKKSKDQLDETYLPTAKLRKIDRLVDIPPGFHTLLDLPSTLSLWSCSGGQHADVHALTQMLTRELPCAVHLREGVEVEGVESGSSQVGLTLTTGERLVVGRLILAPGPWTASSPWSDLLGSLQIRVKKVVALLLDAPATHEDAVIVFDAEDAFLLPMPERRSWLFSFTRHEWDVDPGTMSSGLSVRDIEEARDLLCRYSPQLAARPVAGRVFCDAYSADGQPSVCALDGVGRIVFAGAANGSGYRLGPAIAAQAVQALLPRSSTMSGRLS